MKAWQGLTILVFGISGVGKTRLIQRTKDQLMPVFTWRASEIIGEARNISSGEDLRRLPVNEIQASQELLVRGFSVRRCANPHELVILDAHSVIDADGGLVDIAADVVARLYPAGLIHVGDTAANIHQRRDADAARPRPAREVAELEQYQKRSLEICRRYSEALLVPLVEVISGDEQAFIRAVRRIVDSAPQ
jgi:adenylate kinase